MKNRLFILYFYNVSFLFLIISCNNPVPQNNNNNNNNNESKYELEIVIENETINQKVIYESYVHQLFLLETSAIDLCIENSILKSEASKINLPVDEYINKHIMNSVNKPTLTEIKNYISKNNLSINDTSLVYEYLFSTYQSYRKMEYIDSARSNRNIHIKHPLLLSNVRRIETSSLFSFEINDSNKKIDVYVISNFQCNSCTNADNILFEIIEKYHNEVSFKYIYFSSHYEKEAYALYAANNQNQFIQFYKKLKSISSMSDNDSMYVNLASLYNLDVFKFQQDYSNAFRLLPLLETRDFLIANEIYTVPSFIVNGFVLDNKHSINYLDFLINTQLN
jgi:hypothetical protein